MTQKEPPKEPGNITILAGKTKAVLKQAIPVPLQVHSWLLLVEQTDDEVFAQRVIEQLMGLYDGLDDPLLQMRLLSDVILISENQKSRDWAAGHLLAKAKNTPFENKLEALAFVHVADVSALIQKEQVLQVEKLMEDYAPDDFIGFMSDPELFFSPVVAEFLADLFLINAPYMHNQSMIDYAELLLSRGELLTEDITGKLAAFLIYLSGDKAAQKILAGNAELQELLEEVIVTDTGEAMSWQALLDDNLTAAKKDVKSGRLVKFRKPKPEKDA